MLGALPFSQGSRVGGSGCRCMHVRCLLRRRSGPPPVLRRCWRVRSLIRRHAVGVLPLRVPSLIWCTRRHYWDGSWPRLRNQKHLSTADLCMLVGQACCFQTALHR